MFGNQWSFQQFTVISFFYIEHSIRNTQIQFLDQFQIHFCLQTVGIRFSIEVIKVYFSSRFVKINHNLILEICSVKIKSEISILIKQFELLIESDSFIPGNFRIQSVSF